MSIARRIVLVASAAIFAAAAVVATERPARDADVAVSLGLQRLGSPSALPLMRATSAPGDGFLAPVAIAAAVALGAFLAGRARTAVGVGLLCTVAFGVEQAVKAAVGRPRPSPHVERLAPAPETGSFPSGHMVWFTTLFGAAVDFQLLSRRRALRRLLVVALAAYGVLLGASRVYLGHHYATDVLGGVALAAMLVAGLAPLIRAGLGIGFSGRESSSA